MTTGTKPLPPRRVTHLLAPAAVMAVVLLMVVPLPPLVLDLLLSIDIGLAVVLLLTAIYVKQPVEFSVFPSLLLLLTLIRLSLNVASTRLVLLHGADGIDELLARALHRDAEVGDAIPANLFAAVAEVLAYLVKIKQLML